MSAATGPEFLFAVHLSVIGADGDGARYEWKANVDQRSAIAARFGCAEIPRFDVKAMINMDMVGNPIGANAMGFDSLIPFLEKFSTNLKAYEFAKGVDNKPWLGSDHHPFILKGIPAITLNAPIKPEAVKFYHDFADTFDKVDRIDLAKSIGILTLLTYELANNETLELQQKTEKEVIELLRENKLEERMKRSNAWPFETETDRSTFFLIPTLNPSQLCL